MTPQPSPQELENLARRAVEAMERAYCRYSGFAVGAAILTDQGSVVTGCNVENASYGLTICAERVAMTRCIAEGAGSPVAIAVAARPERPVTPCGACRQVLAEFNPRLVVLCVGGGGEREQHRLDELLPGAFGPADLDAS